MLDKPLIQYPIDLALQSNQFESVWVNTESKELGEACKRLGVQFHERPAELANDKATNRDFVYEFLCKHECDYVIMMNPTSPTLRKETVDKFIEFVQNNDYDTVMSVVSVQAEAFYQGKTINFDKSDKIPSEKLEPVEEIIWAMTAWKRETFLRLQDSGQCPVFGGKLATFAIPKDESADLDSEEDWNIAEGILKARQMKESVQAKYLEL